MVGTASHILRMGGVLAVAALGFTTGACSSGPSTEDFLQEANAVCTEHQATIEAAASKVLAGGQLPSPKAFGKLAQETIIPELTAQFNELRPIEAPDELATAYDDFLSQGEQAVAALSQDPSMLTNADNFSATNDQSDEVGLSDSCHVGP